MRTLLILLLTISFISCGKKDDDRDNSFSSEKYQEYKMENQFQYLESKIQLDENYSQTFLIEDKNIKDIYFKLNGSIIYELQEIKNQKIDITGLKKLYCEYDIFTIVDEKKSLDSHEVSQFFDIYFNNTLINIRHINWNEVSDKKILKIDIILKKELTKNLFGGAKFLKGPCLKDKFFGLYGQEKQIFNKLNKKKASPKVEGSIELTVENYIFAPTSSPK